MLVLHMLHL